MPILSGPSHHLVEGMNKAIESARVIADPVARSKALAYAISTANDLSRTLSAERAVALEEAVAASTVAAVAAELGVTRQRLYQLLDG